MKKLIVLLLALAGAVSADDGAATSFVTGFANALAQQLGGAPYVPPAQQQQINVVQPRPNMSATRWRAVDAYGNTWGNYLTLPQCRRGIVASPSLVDCVLGE